MVKQVSLVVQTSGVRIPAMLLKLQSAKTWLETDTHGYHLTISVPSISVEPSRRVIVDKSRISTLEEVF